MKLPNGENVRLNPKKLWGYCLDAQHEDGLHKARVFASAVGITPANWTLLRDALLEAAATGEAELRERGYYGDTYRIDFMFDGPGGSAFIKSGWIVRHDGTTHFVTCVIRA